MKRRTFTFGLGALAVAPALPVAATPTATAAQHFTLAKLLARSHNHCSAAMLQRHLKVSPEMARQVRRMLLDRGVITAPVNGVSMAVSPTNTNCVPTQALKPTNLVQQFKKLRDMVDRIQTEDPDEKITEDEHPTE